MNSYAFSHKNPDKNLNLLYYLFLYGTYSKEDISRTLSETLSRSEKRIYFLEDSLGEDHLKHINQSKKNRYFANYDLFEDSYNFLINIFLTKTTTNQKINGYFHVMDILFPASDKTSISPLSPMEILDQLNYRNIEMSESSVYRLLRDMKSHGLIKSRNSLNKTDYYLEKDYLSSFEIDQLSKLYKGLCFFSDIAFPFVLGEMTRKNLQSYIEIYRNQQLPKKQEIHTTNVGFHLALSEDLLFQIIPFIHIKKPMTLITEQGKTRMIPSYFSLTYKSQDIILHGSLNEKDISLSVFDIISIEGGPSDEELHDLSEVFEIFNEYESIYHYLIYHALFFTDDKGISIYELMNELNEIGDENDFQPTINFYENLFESSQKKKGIQLFTKKGNVITNTLKNRFYINFSTMELLYLHYFLNSSYAPLFLNREEIQAFTSIIPRSIQEDFKGIEDLFNCKEITKTPFPKQLRANIAITVEHIDKGQNFVVEELDKEVQPLRIQYDCFDERFDLLYSHPDTEEVFIKALDSLTINKDMETEDEPDIARDKEEKLGDLVNYQSFTQTLSLNDTYIEDWLLKISTFERTINRDCDYVYIKFMIYDFQLDDFYDALKAFGYERTL